MVNNFYWLAINLKEHVKLEKKPILIKCSKEEIDYYIKQISKNIKDSSFLITIDKGSNKILFFIKDIYLIKVSAVKNETVDTFENLPDENGVIWADDLDEESD